MVKDFLSLLLARLGNPVVLAALLLAALVYSGIVHLADRHAFFVPVEREALCEIKGTISTNPVKNRRGTSYTCRLAAESVTAVVRGSTITASAAGEVAVSIPAAAVEAFYPGRLYSRAASQALLAEVGERVRCTGQWVPSAELFRVRSVEATGHSPGIAGKVLHVRSLCRLFFKRLMFSWGAAGALVLSLLSGSRDYLDPSVGDSFRLAGLSHVLALSGMHLSFFSGLAGSVGAGLFGKKYRAVLGLVGIAFFVWFAGLSPSLLRALLCALFMLAARAVFCTEVDFFAVLSAVFLVHVVLVPSDVQDAAFMLSYGALAGILLFSDAVHAMLVRLVPPALSAGISAAVGAQVATVPVCANVFGTVMPVGIVSSVVVSPLVSLFLALAVCGILASLALPFLSPLFGTVLNWLYAALLGLVELFSRVPPVVF